MNKKILGKKLVKRVKNDLRASVQFSIGYYYYFFYIISSLFRLLALHRHAPFKSPCIIIVRRGRVFALRAG